MDTQSTTNSSNSTEQHEPAAAQTNIFHTPYHNTILTGLVTITALGIVSVSAVVAAKRGAPRLTKTINFSRRPPPPQQLHRNYNNHSSTANNTTPPSQTSNISTNATTNDTTTTSINVATARQHTRTSRQAPAAPSAAAARARMMTRKRNRHNGAPSPPANSATSAAAAATATTALTTKTRLTAQSGAPSATSSTNTHRAASRHRHMQRLSEEERTKLAIQALKRYSPAKALFYATAISLAATGALVGAAFYATGARSIQEFANALRARLQTLPCRVDAMLHLRTRRAAFEQSLHKNSVFGPLLHIIGDLKEEDQTATQLMKGQQAPDDTTTDHLPAFPHEVTLGLRAGDMSHSSVELEALRREWEQETGSSSSSITTRKSTSESSSLR